MTAKLLAECVKLIVLGTPKKAPDKAKSSCVI